MSTAKIITFTTVLLLNSITYSMAELKELNRWELSKVPKEGIVSVKNNSGVSIQAACYIKSGPVRFSIKIPKAFTQSSNTIAIKIEVNNQKGLNDYVKEVNSKRKSKLKPPLTKEELDKLTLAKYRFIQFMGHLTNSEGGSSSVDEYRSDLSRRFEGKTFLRILRDALSKIHVTIEFINKNKEDIKGSAYLSSLNSTKTFTTFNVQYCGI